MTDPSPAWDAIIDAAPAGLLVCDGEGRIVHANPAAAHIFRCEREALRGRPIEELVHPQSRQRFGGYRREALDASPPGERPKPALLVGARVNGDPFALEIDIVRGPDGDRQQDIAVLSDVTAQRRDDERRRIVEERDRHSQHMQSIGRLAGGFAHDFNNVLATVLASAELALEQVEDPDVVGDLRLIVHAAYRGKHLVQDVLEFSKRQVPEPGRHTMWSLVHDAEKALRESLPSGVDLSLGSICSETVLADPVAIRQLLYHLVANSVRSMPTGGSIRISCQLIERDGDGEAKEPDPVDDSETGSRRLELAVRDTGRDPIDPHLDSAPLAEAVEPAPGAHEALGLAVALSIVEEHSGTMRIQRVEGEGTTVRCFLPAAPKPDTYRI